MPKLDTLQGQALSHVDVSKTVLLVATTGTALWRQTSGTLVIPNGRLVLARTRGLTLHLRKIKSGDRRTHDIAHRNIRVPTTVAKTEAL